MYLPNTSSDDLRLSSQYAFSGRVHAAASRRHRHARRGHRRVARGLAGRFGLDVCDAARQVPPARSSNTKKHRDWREIRFPNLRYTEASTGGTGLKRAARGITALATPDRCAYVNLAVPSGIRPGTSEWWP